MSPYEQLPPLSARRRRLIFLLMVLTFTVAVPLMVFYAIGYRFDFSEELYDFKAVGGLYISSEVEDSRIFVEGELVENMRIFRNAAYIQNLEEGVHEVYVEQDNLHTWVKELPVFSHLVTEAQSFNMPLRPQIRLITEWNNSAGIGVVFENATSTYFGFASTTELLELATSTVATSSFNENLEHAFIMSRFASSSQEAAVRERYEEYRAQRFNFAGEEDFVATSTATTTVEFSDTRLFEQAGEVYAQWLGDIDDIPYYYCVTNKGDAMTSRLYGAHVYDQVIDQTPTTTDLLQLESFDQRFCRDTIRIDRKGQEVIWFDFMPDSEHLVLMHLSDGLYVVEVDDRAWQNTQLLYPGTDIEVLLEGDRIFVHDNDYYLEVFTQIAE